MYLLNVELDVRQDQSILPLHHNPPWPNISFIKFNAKRFLHIHYPRNTDNVRFGSREFDEERVIGLEPWSESIYVKQSTLNHYGKAVNMIKYVLCKIGIVAAECPGIVNKFTFHAATTVMEARRDGTRIAALVVDITTRVKMVNCPVMQALVLLDRAWMLRRKTIIPWSSIQLIKAARANKPDMSSVDDCSICLESIGDASQLYVLPCSHLFHKHCALNWFRVTPTCPLCRFSYA